MTVCRIYHYSVSSSIHQRLHALQGIISHTHSGSHTKTTLLVLAGHGLVFCLGDILVGDQTHQPVVLIHHGQLLDLVLLQNLGSCRKVSLLMCRHQMF